MRISDKIFVPVPVLRATVVERIDVSTIKAGHGDTIGRRRAAGVLKANTTNYDREIKQPVNERDIDLTDSIRRYG